MSSQKSHVFPQQSLIISTKSSIFAPKSPIFPQKSLVLSQQSSISSQKNPIFPQRYNLSKEPYILSKVALYWHLMRPIISQKSPTLHQKCRIFFQKSPVVEHRFFLRRALFFLKRALQGSIEPIKSPTLTQKSLTFCCSVLQRVAVCCSTSQCSPFRAQSP